MEFSQLSCRLSRLRIGNVKTQFLSTVIASSGNTQTDTPYTVLSPRRYQKTFSSSTKDIFNAFAVFSSLHIVREAKHMVRQIRTPF